MPGHHSHCVCMIFTESGGQDSNARVPFPLCLICCKYKHYFNNNNKTDDIFSHSNKKSDGMETDLLFLE